MRSVNRNILFLVFCIQSLLLLSPIDNASTAELFQPYVRVQVFNKLPEESELTIHCKSKENDLGRQVIKARGFYDFSFRPNFFGGTLFFCGVTWNKNNTEIEPDIYVQKRDTERCLTRCAWDVNAKGLLGYREDNGENDITYEWSPYGN